MTKALFRMGTRPLVCLCNGMINNQFLYTRGTRPEMLVMMLLGIVLARPVSSSQWTLGPMISATSPA